MTGRPTLCLYLTEHQLKWDHTPFISYKYTHIYTENMLHTSVYILVGVAIYVCEYDDEQDWEAMHTTDSV